jgi:hypothetical protein
MPTRHRTTVVAGVAAAALSLVALCACSRPSAPAPTSSAPSPTSTAPPSGVKPVISGLVDRQGEPPKDMLSVVHAYVVKVNWADLQPTPFGPIASDNAIDKAIARVRMPDYKAVDMALKLRVFAGIGAPEWVKSLGGNPIPYVNNQPGGSTPGGTIGRFWSADFGKAYVDLQTKLAAKYDVVPEIREITVSRCSTIFDELFVRQPGDVQNNAALKGAGYTEAADEQCIQQAVQAHDVWKHTTSDVDFSPFPNVADPSQPPDLAFTERVMHLCRDALGVRCGLQNNAISTDKLANETFTSMYGTMTSLGPPIILQTAANKRIGDEEQVLQAAVKIGANSVELPAGYQKWPESMLQTAAQGLAGNPLPAGETTS